VKLFTYIDERGEENVGILINENKFVSIIDLVREFESIFPMLRNRTSLTVVELMKLGENFLKKVEKVIEEITKERLAKLSKVTSDYKIIAPIPRPPMIYALARNYRAHAEEVNLSVPSEPAIFIKSPTSVIGPNEDIIIPKFLKRVDYEAELAVVIGKRGKNIPRDKAMDFVFGYTCFNDVTARDVQLKCIKEDLPWDLAKSADTFGPMGPYIVTKDQVTNPHNLRIELRVNGITKQLSNTKYMIFKIPEIIEYISKFVTLEPGTIITTGTPEGIGELKPGDLVEVEIGGIGILRNRAIMSH